MLQPSVESVTQSSPLRIHATDCVERPAGTCRNRRICLPLSANSRLFFQCPTLQQVNDSPFSTRTTRGKANLFLSFDARMQTPRRDPDDTFNALTKVKPAKSGFQIQIEEDDDQSATRLRAHPVTKTPKASRPRVPGAGTVPSTEEMSPKESDWTASPPLPKSTTILPIPAAE